MLNNSQIIDLFGGKMQTNTVATSFPEINISWAGPKLVVTNNADGAELFNKTADPDAYEIYDARVEDVAGPADITVLIKKKNVSQSGNMVTQTWRQETTFSVERIVLVDAVDLS